MQNQWKAAKAARLQRLDASVNLTNGDRNVNRLMSRLSDQQWQILDVIARMERNETGRYQFGAYDPGDITRELAEPGDRSASASISRALVRLEARGLLKRRAVHAEPKKGDLALVWLTKAGLVIVNAIRAQAGLDLLDMAYPKRPMTAAEFTAAADRIRAAYAVLRAKDAAAGLTPSGLEELRQWIDNRLAEMKSGATVNQLNMRTTG